MASNSDGPRVFLTYSHDSPEHNAAVLALAKRLRSDGCIVVIDQEQDWVPETWTVWMMRQIEQADFVLVICTEVYKRRAEGREAPPIGRVSPGKEQSSAGTYTMRMVGTTSLFQC